VRERCAILRRIATLREWSRGVEEAFVLPLLTDCAHFQIGLALCVVLPLSFRLFCIRILSYCHPLRVVYALELPYICQAGP